jgi:hypothetical protein
MAVGYNTSVATSGLVLALDAANPKSYPGSGTTWYDISGSGNHAVVENGSPTWGNTGTFAGGAFNLNSANFKTANTYGGLSTFTVETWFQPTSYTANSASVIADFYPSFVNFKIGYDGGNLMSAGIYNGVWLYVNSNFAVPLNIWTYVAFTWTGNNGVGSVYQNGVLLAATSIAISSTSSNNGIRIGRRWDNPDYFMGYISSVKIYNRALSADEISKNFNAHRGRYGI